MRNVPCSLVRPLVLPFPQELTRPGCFDGAYARGLWAAGFSFEVVPDAAAFSEALPSPRGCREGTSMPLEGYSVFLLVSPSSVDERATKRLFES